MYLKTDNEELIELYRALKTNGDINGIIIVYDHDIVFPLSNTEYGVDDISDLNDILRDTTLDVYLDIKYKSITVEMEHKIMTGDYEGMMAKMNPMDIVASYINGNFDQMVEQIKEYGEYQFFKDMESCISHYDLKEETFMKITVMYFKERI